MKKHLFSGSAAALITPFQNNGRDVDFEFYETLLEWQLQHETDALVIAGTTGESPVLSKEEKKQLFSKAVSAADKKIPVIAGAGSNNTYVAIKNANDAEKEGVDGLLIVTPFYNKCTQDGLIKHYYTIADRVSVPIIVYNVPSRTGVNILPETYAVLAEHPRIAGIKEANGDLSAAAKTAALCKGKAALYSGNDEQTVSMMAVGAVGVISVAANIIPREMHRITQFALKNDAASAAYLQGRYLRLMELLFTEVNPIPIKYAVSELFSVNQTLRLPLTELTIKNKQSLSEEMHRLKLLS